LGKLLDSQQRKNNPKTIKGIAIHAEKKTLGGGGTTFFAMINWHQKL
jgi:hypothetical protein